MGECLTSFIFVFQRWKGYSGGSRTLPASWKGGIAPQHSFSVIFGGPKRSIACLFRTKSSETVNPSVLLEFCIVAVVALRFMRLKSADRCTGQKNIFGHFPRTLGIPN